MPGTSAQEPISWTVDSKAVEAAGPDGIRSERDDRQAAAFSLRRFFQPRSVAVIGDSRDPAGIGHRIFDALIQNGFRGSVFPINPKAAVISGVRAYSSLPELPERVDLAGSLLIPELTAQTKKRLASAFPGLPVSPIRSI
jgi:hypothetical protein